MKPSDVSHSSDDTVSAITVDSHTEFGANMAKSGDTHSRMMLLK